MHQENVAAIDEKAAIRSLIAPEPRADGLEDRASGAEIRVSNTGKNRHCRRERFRNAIATARLALAWPTTYLSSSATISRGVSESMEVDVRSGSEIDILDS